MPSFRMCLMRQLLDCNKALPRDSATTLASLIFVKKLEERRQLGFRCGQSCAWKGRHAARRISSQRCRLDGPRFRGGFIGAHSIRVRCLPAALTFTTCFAEAPLPQPTLRRRSERRLQHNQKWSRHPLRITTPKGRPLFPSAPRIAANIAKLPELSLKTAA
jgi:hypothetical protein